MTKIVWTEPAVDDLDSIHAHISRDAAIYADATILERISSTDQLLEHPKSGRRIPELNDDLHRELLVASFRVMYFIKPDRVEITAVIHGARKFRKT